MEKAEAEKASSIYVPSISYMLLCVFGGGIFQVAGGQTSLHDAASLIYRLIFHVFTNFLVKTR